MCTKTTDKTDLEISHGKNAIFFSTKKLKKKRNVGSKRFSVQKIIDSARTRTWNLWFRRPTRYPLRHRTSFFLTLIRGQQETAGFGYINLLKRLMLQLIIVQSASCALNQCTGLPCRRAVCHDTSQCVRSAVLLLHSSGVDRRTHSHASAVFIQAPWFCLQQCSRLASTSQPWTGWRSSISTTPSSLVIPTHWL